MHGWRRALILGAAAAVAVPLIGVVYEHLAERAAPPPPGRLYPVAGHRMHIRCLGAGTPPVVFDASGPAWSASWEDILPQVATTTRACAYDRAGWGWSEPSTEPRTAERMAGELAALLDAAGVESPRVLVGASTGGLIVEYLARSRPDGVAGLVLVDAPDETVFSDVPEPWPAMERMARQASWAARVGALRLLDPLRIATLPPASAAVLRPLIYETSAWQAITAMLAARDESARQLAALPPIAPDLPLIVLVHGVPRDIYGPGLDGIAERTEPTWRKMETGIASRSRRGRLLTVEGSGHLISASHPERIVEAVSDVVRDSRHR
jgi:pimeloyl-ACP methyl ester carboxylesterase